jgi:DNA-binding MarR family transcriptional regulator
MSSDPEHLGWLIKRLQHAHHRALDARLAHLDVTLVQWNALREIARNPGASQHQIAERTFNSDQAFGTLMTRLEVRGLVERRPGEGRVNVARLTRKGASLLQDGQAVFHEVISGSFAPLKKAERAELSRLLGKVLAEGAASIGKGDRA